ncbi:hypothetical protein [Bradyrhizobium symbiodeficiens]|uniref:hypothetical protein n=1 Tax=Bradyrhizobium symbiodeficiens TaxID=1404367 RepID=UPI000BA1AFCC|nr:hypothetical protein [Bradyrhizobium symbiodeficiens]AWM05865.1 hypothetical protein CIT39_04955 [Bradyrhizobium symbiodeficiens]
MYIAGGALLVAGVLLCISVAWAASGFVLMGCGLICFLIADRRKRAREIQLAATSALTDPFIGGSPTPTQRGEDPQQEQSWQLLMDADPDLERIATILAGFGRRYVDQLATVYTVFDRKDFLPIILEMIISADKSLSEALAGQSDFGTHYHDPIREAAIEETPQVWSARADEGEMSVQPRVLHCDRDEPLAADIAVGASDPETPDLDDEDSLRKLFDKLLVDKKVVDTFGAPPELSSR